MTGPKSALLRYDDFFGMLDDSVRMDAYARAIRQEVRPGDVVVDLGAGTGILGFLALKAGAKKVYAVEKSDAIELARAVAAHNGLADRMVFVNESSLDAVLPEKADIIVSETLGSFGLDESTLHFTVDARDRWLKPGGRLLPKRIRLYAAPVDALAPERKVRFWEDVAGIDFSPALETFARKVMVESVQPNELLAEPWLFADVDFATATGAIVEGVERMPIMRAGRVRGFVGWFDADLADGIELTTAPGEPDTHWKQAFLPIRESFEVVRGDILELTLRIAPKERGSDDAAISYDYRCTQLGSG